jgi:hypothetical protein
VELLQVWAHVFNHVAAAIVAFQVVMIGLLGIKGALWPSLLLTPLPFLSVSLWCVRFWCSSTF